VRAAILGAWLGVRAGVLDATTQGIPVSPWCVARGFIAKWTNPHRDSDQRNWSAPV